MKKRFRDQLTLSSKIKYCAWRLLMPVRREAEVGLSLRNGDRIFLRNSDDYGVAYEVFVTTVYPVPKIDARMVLDLGGHVGFSALFLAKRFPAAQIMVLEPDCGRAGQIRKHVQANGLGTRVEVIEAAAGNRNGKARLSQHGSSSQVGTDGDAVRLVDVFELLDSHKVDVLKMDIEGGEYAILADTRFVALTPDIIAMEWHATPSHVDGRRWCHERLEELGYRITAESGESERAGNLVAERPWSTSLRQQDC
jgi:FkbM family methyltransferase